jgi:hypothetical protein
MELYHDRARPAPRGGVVHETPWASAWLIADNPTTIAHYAAICAFHAWCKQEPDDLPNAEADVRYAQELAARDLDEVQLDAYWRPWSIRMPDGEWREIGPPHVESDGYLTWRW